MQETQTFDRKPYGNTDEDGETAYVDCTAATATPEAAMDWLLRGEGAREVLGCDSSRRVKEGAELRPEALVVSIPAEMAADGLPDVVSIGSMIRAGRTAWWTFPGCYDVTEEVIDEGEYRALVEERRAARRAEAMGRARRDRGWLGWRARCWLADALASVGAFVDPADRTTVGWHTEEGAYVIATVRGRR